MVKFKFLTTKVCTGTVPVLKLWHIWRWREIKQCKQALLWIKVNFFQFCNVWRTAIHKNIKNFHSISKLCKTWGRVLISIKMEIRIRSGIKTMPIQLKRCRSTPHTGCFYRAVLTCECKGSQTYNPPQPFSHWLLQWDPKIVTQIP